MGMFGEGGRGCRNAMQLLNCLCDLVGLCKHNGLQLMWKFVNGQELFDEISKAVLA
jgi:hypothetical protein